MPQPNILLIFSDQQHYEAIGSVDSRFETPALDRLRSDCIVFDRAFCTTPQCSPSRSSMLTGLYPTKTGVMGNQGAAGGQPMRAPTLAPALQRVGYETAYFGKWHLGDDAAGMAGWDEDVGVTAANPGDSAITERACAYLNRERERPFTLFLSYNDPHDVYSFNPAMTGVGSLPDSWHKQDFGTVPNVHRQFMAEDQGTIIHSRDADVWLGYREHYAEMVARYDRQVGRVMQALEESGKLEETLVVVTSDHGDMDGNHRLIFKGPFMYEHMVRVPLMFRVPECMDSRHQRSSDFDAVLIDLVPTLLEVAGCMAQNPTDGISLVPFLAGKRALPRRDFVIGQYFSKQCWVNPIRMIRTREYKYNRYRPDGEELYDLQADPDEVVNLAGSEDHSEIRDGLYSQLERWIEENDDPFDTLVATDRAGSPREER